MTLTFTITRRRFLLFVFIAALIIAASVAQSIADDAPPPHEWDCPDLEYQEDAQAMYDHDTTDPFGLDGDDDGVPCQNLPHRPK